ncbi:MAG: asparagine synthetase B, partial [Bacteroidetes bacterium]|nr:asparagine synthetase B [Bacteroidota bacterium]
MCGIAGAYAFKAEGESFLNSVEASLPSLSKRGPNSHGIFRHSKIALGHTRLSIIDTSVAASQPFTDASGRYTIIYNGEFFNFKEYRQTLKSQGVQFKSTSDTETLLYLFMAHGPKCLEKINGFFAFAVYDQKEDSLFIARDRMGIKPLYYDLDEERLLFASEMKAMMALGVKKELDHAS